MTEKHLVARMATAMLWYQGLTNEQIEEAKQISHRHAGCTFDEEYGYTCTDRYGNPTHPYRAKMVEAIELATIALFALRGNVIPDPESREFKLAIRPIADEWGFVYEQPPVEMGHIIRRGAQEAAKSPTLWEQTPLKEIFDPPTCTMCGREAVIDEWDDWIFPCTTGTHQDGFRHD